MPILSGTEAAKRITGRYPEAKIIFITAMGDSSELIDDLSSLPEDCYRILTKPIKKEELQYAITELSEM